jgi:outer membrane protein assembly factor BamB
VLRNLAAAQLDDELALDGVFLPPDRTAKRRLETAGQMISERRYGEAVRLLGSLLENSEDFFFKPDAGQPVYRSLKAEAGRMIANLPDAGRESYELQYGARARGMLKEAVKRGSLTELAEISRQFFFTAAGQEATFLLARQHLDENRPMAAALCFERLLEGRAGQRLEPALSLSLATCWLRAGKPEKARSALLRLKRSMPGAEVAVAGKSIKLFSDDSKAAAWIEETFGPQRAVAASEVNQWAMFRGDEGRNAQSAGGRPLLEARWRQRTADDRTVEKFVAQLRQDYLSQEIVALPSFHPLAVGDVVLMRTAFALQAVDLASGKLVWKYAATDDSLEQFLKAGSTPQPGRSVQLFSGLDQRMWEDAVYGTISSDGDHVYYVDDLGLGVSGSPLRTVLPNGRRVHVSSRNANRLAARELRSEGKLKWEVGGITGQDEPKLAGAFFLGPPLPLLGNLYALAEFKEQEIRLVVLSAQNGALRWSQQLAVVELPVTQDTYRRNAGATPSFADGLLVCPTSAGAVVAIDLTTRSLVWGYQYPRFQQNPPDRFNAARFAIYPGSERRANEHWVDGSITIADGCVLVTPVESDQIFCLDLTSGKELWKQDREDHLYVACVHDGRVVLVGRERVGALNLSDGQRAWPDVELPPGSMPSGRGFASGDDYYLPLSSAEVAKINIQAGQMTERARSRSGNIPGNLIAFRDAIISQGVDYVDAYFQLDALKRQIADTLRTRPDDPKALAALAAVKLDQGLLADAIELYRRSYAAEASETTREQFAEALLEGLRVDFAAHRGSIEELESLIARREHTLVYLRVVASGLQAAGEVGPAFDAYLRLIDSDDSAALDTIDDSLAVARASWIRAQLEQLRAAAGDDQRQHIDDEARKRFATASAAGSTDALRQYLAVFGSNPVAAVARAALLEKLDGDNLLECDALARQLQRSSSRGVAARATARMARLLVESGRADLAAVYYRQLADEFAQVECADGKTGRQWVSELPSDSPIHRWLAADKPWPQGKVTARQSQVPLRGSSQRPPRSVDLEVVGPTGPFFRDLTVSLDLQTQVLVGQDAVGQKLFRIPIYEQRTRPISTSRFNMYNAPPLSYVSVNGGLLVLSMSNQVMAIDTMRGGEHSSNHLLWSQNLSDQIGGFQTGQGIYSRPVAVAWGGTRYVPEDTYGRRYGSIGPVTDEGVYFQRLRDLHCVDPWSGNTVWLRRNVGLGNQLFGDEELLFVAPAGDADTLVLRAATGEKLGVRRIAPFEKRMLTIGRNVLSWEAQGGQQLLQMRDAWEDKTLWSFTFHGGAKAAIASGQAVGVLEPDGVFSLVTLPDGRRLVKEQLEPEKALVGIYLLRSSDRYLLVTNSAARLEPPLNVQPIAGAANHPMVNGRVYAFDQQTGNKSWPSPVVVAQYGLVANQPSQLPLLVFVRQAHRPGGAGGREPRTSVLCIDKRTGQVAYQNDALPTTMVGNFELSGDPVKHTVTLTLPPQVIELTLTDERPSPPPNALSD